MKTMLKKLDNSYLSRKIKHLAGVDEAGRGPLAGPVVAAAVMFDRKTKIPGINDSKQLKEKERERLFEEIKSKCICYGIGIIDQTEIDEVNILQATLKAMKQAVDKLSPKPDMILIDGNKSFVGEIPAKTIIKGDSKSFSIAAASILAKVTRDRMMKEASVDYPHYVWHKNKGYGTREHITAIQKHGITPIHRKTFLTKILPAPQLELAYKIRTRK